MPTTGVEPARSCEHCVLSAACLPFHQVGVQVEGVEPSFPKESVFETDVYAVPPHLRYDGWTRTSDLPANDRALFRLSYVAIGTFWLQTS